MFIDPLSISSIKKCEKERIRIEKPRFPREIGHLRGTRFLRPPDFPKKTRREPEESIREVRENAEKTSTGDKLEIGLFSFRGGIN
jgi:hypothetical protein